MQNNNNQEVEVLNVLRGFFAAMHEWDNKTRTALANNNNALARKQALDALDSIFKQYCTHQESKLNRQLALNLEEPPEYGKANQSISQMEIAENKAQVYVQQLDGFENDYRYTLLYQNEQWRIDKKECWNKTAKQWEEYYLYFAWKKDEDPNSPLRKNRKRGIRLEKRKAYTLAEILRYFLQRGLIESDCWEIGGNFSLYTASNDEPYTEDMICWLDVPEKIVEDETLSKHDPNRYKVVTPQFIRTNDLELCYDGSQLIDVIQSVLYQQGNPTIPMLVDALNYYMEYDTYLDIEEYLNNACTPPEPEQIGGRAMWGGGKAGKLGKL